MSALLLTSAVAVLALAACETNRRAGFTDALTLGGRVVPAATLNMGQTLYTRTCVACHGAKGDAKTPNTDQLDPKPRSFVDEPFKHTEAGPGELPRDEEIAHTIRNGVPGTAMAAWGIFSDVEVDALVQYLKTFSLHRWEAPSASPTER